MHTSKVGLHDRLLPHAWLFFTVLRLNQLKNKDDGEKISKMFQGSGLKFLKLKT